MYGAKYVWFFIGWYEDDWFQKHLEDENINCTVAQMEEAAEAHFTTEALQWNQDKSPTISGKVGSPLTIPSALSALSIQFIILSSQFLVLSFQLYLGLRQ